MSTKRRKIAELKGATTQEAIFRSRIDVINRGIQKIEVQIQQSRRLLAKRHIYAPIDAIVNEVYVNAGAYAEDGDRVFLLHDPGKLWVEAPVDDSDVRHVAIGQGVEVDIDAYPYVDFTGVVIAIGQATVGSMTGNNDSSRGAPKIPVRIALNPSESPLWPGVRATAHIRIR
jgi:membrane fusion protein (multidrug efflux system)